MHKVANGIAPEYSMDLLSSFYSFVSGIVNPLYNGIRYNSKTRYNVSPICTKNQRIVYCFLDNPMSVFGKTYVLDIYKNRPAEAILTNIYYV